MNSVNDQAPSTNSQTNSKGEVRMLETPVARLTSAILVRTFNHWPIANYLVLDACGLVFWETVARIWRTDRDCDEFLRLLDFRNVHRTERVRLVDVEQRV